MREGDMLTRLTEASVLRSELDDSVNFITRGDYPGAIEARYVRRDPDEVIVYLSSQTGCAKACRFCHLTQSGQTDGRDVTINEYLTQAKTVLEHYDQLVEEGGPAARTVNFNFMARGEVFANRAFLDGSSFKLLDALASLGLQRRLLPRFKLSTIMPRELDGRSLAELFPRLMPDIYYSLYSVDERWRRRWMPKALPAQHGLGMLADYAKVTRKIPVIHFALIAGENDQPQHMDAIAEAIGACGLRCDINLVRYNPFSDRQGAASNDQVMDRCARQLAEALPGCRVQIVGRVGYDVKASCGMFVAGRNTKKPRQLAQLPLLPTSPSVIHGHGA